MLAGRGQRTPLTKKGTWERGASGLLRREGWVKALRGRGKKQKKGHEWQSRPPVKEHADLSVREACGCADRLREEGVLWGSQGKCLPQRSGLASPLASPRFEEKNQRLLELNQRCQFASSATMQWLDIRLQLMGAAVVSAIAGIALVQHQQGLANPGTTPGPFTPLRSMRFPCLAPDLSLRRPPAFSPAAQGP